jgi:hypothetical protein
MMIAIPSYDYKEHLFSRTWTGWKTTGDPKRRINAIIALAGAYRDYIDLGCRSDFNTYAGYDRRDGHKIGFFEWKGNNINIDALDMGEFETEPRERTPDPVQARGQDITLFLKSSNKATDSLCGYVRSSAMNGYRIQASRQADGVLLKLEMIMEVRLPDAVATRMCPYMDFLT